MDMRTRFQANVTMVANEFIDRHMASANGEYVKVYLYILRHQGEEITLESIADALNHTEADVKRAVAFWEKTGVLVSEETEEMASGDGSYDKREEMAAAACVECLEPSGIVEMRKSCTADQMERLAGEEDFSQLLYIAQKYMNKVFTPKDCEVFAYLYDSLHMSAELLEYLVEHCVQTGHSSIRYLEKVALSWHERKIQTIEKAKAYTVSYTKDGFAVMQAFGLGDRRPAEVEKEMMERWFQEYGFTRNIVIEACNRTIAAIHSPSFQYADKILSEWKNAGVRHLDDIRVLDERRKQSENGSGKKAPQIQQKNRRNQFHNFEQRNTNYDAMVLERLKERLGE